MLNTWQISICTVLHNTIDGCGVCYSLKCSMATYTVTTAVYTTYHSSLKGMFKIVWHAVSICWQVWINHMKQCLICLICTYIRPWFRELFCSKTKVWFMFNRFIIVTMWPVKIILRLLVYFHFLNGSLVSNLRKRCRQPATEFWPTDLQTAQWSAPRWTFLKGMEI